MYKIGFEPSSFSNHSWTGTYTYNQVATSIEMTEAGTIYKAKVYYGGRNGSVNSRLVLWDKDGNILATSKIMSVKQATETANGQDWVEAEFTTPYKAKAGEELKVGYIRDLQGGAIYGRQASSGYEIERLSTSTNNPQKMTGTNKQANSRLGAVIFYYTKPNNPTASCSYISDTKASINWSLGSLAKKEAHTVSVERWEKESNTWTQIANLAADLSETFEDSTIEKNRLYKYRIKVSNQYESSDLVETNYISTTPNEVLNLTIERQGKDIFLNWNTNNLYDVKYHIYHKDDLSGYEFLAETIGTSLLHVSPEGGSHQYKVVVVSNDLNSNTIQSLGVESEIVNLIQPPQIPTSLNTIADATSPVKVIWNYQSEAGDNQRKYQIKYREQGDLLWTETEEIVSNKSEHTFIDLLNNKIYEFQVQVWGESEDSSGYSSTYLITTSKKPTLMITNYSVFETPYFTLDWIYSQEEGKPQTGYKVEVKESGESIYSIEGSGNTDSLYLDTPLQNDKVYQIELQVKSEVGLWSDIVVLDLLVQYVKPEEPIIRITKDYKNLSLNIDVLNTPNDEISVVRNDIYRIINNKEEFITSIKSNSSTKDFLPFIGLNKYRIKSVSNIDTFSETVIEISFLSFGSYVLNYSNNFSKSIILKYNVSLEENIQKETMRKRYQGRKYPVSYNAAGLNQEISFSCEVPVEQLEQVRAISTEKVVYFRDYFNRRFMADIEGCSFTKLDRDFFTFSFKLVRVEEVF